MISRNYNPYLIEECRHLLIHTYACVATIIFYDSLAPVWILASRE
jgi:hypothetical protein